MIELRELKQRDELLEVQQLEQLVWDMAPIPLHQTMTAVKHGGLIIGAYSQQQLVGFSYGFAGYTEGEAYLCSHMLGIHPEFRSQKIGERLKEYQRKVALEKGYHRIIWTYDPLESRNAYLNLTKLRGICSTYIENCYGEMEDGLNKGLPSDRFEIHWYIDTPHISTEPTRNERDAVSLGSISWEEDHPMFYPTGEVMDAPVYTLPIPKDFQSLKQQNPELAYAWRIQTRAVFQELFAKGYCATELVQGQDENRYLFVKQSMLSLGGTPL
ncbi:GNAT family N-acetyltransferase [Chryseomicrobium excrementi]|uniref:GNAT family N-acetyltransferase n=1 Tax=Chryseomicrobium excrementi TaxID=2041346 RepID=A0A2M9F0U3_9BACL|nr:GNAT family N-acetyltransferase [Chryseomicrobium excrementi]PJK17076.1 GNAT family N-acetyltransferase [Chryseomicrobium excrementi]